MKRSFAILALSALSVFPGTAQAQLEPLEPVNPSPTTVTDGPSEEVVSSWFIELKGNPKAAGGSAAALANEKTKFRAAAKGAGVSFTEKYSYDTLFNGFSVRVSEAGASRLARLPQVKNVYPVIEMRVPEVEPGPVTDLSTAISTTQAEIAQNTLGLTGQGVFVAILDTGIDIDHPDLGGCFGPGCRVAYGRDYVGDAYNNDGASPNFNPVPTPDAIPDDCNGHGTHVAGIVGANGGIKGVAPNVTLGAYRVFGCEGSTSADIMVAAMEQILADGADVVNISIGSAYQWPQYPTAVAADLLVDNGVVVVTSAGNNGANGAYAVGAPGVGEKVIATANFNNTVLKSPVFLLSPDDAKISYSASNGGAPVPFTGTLTLARTGTTATVDDGCAALPAGSLTGKAALIRRGTCGFYDKVINAKNAGAVAVVIYNNAAGVIVPNVFPPNPPGTGPAVGIPVVSVTAADGAIIDGRIAAGATTLTWSALTNGTPIAAANLISASSSYGMSPNLSLKPDIGAPGGSIRSTFPLELNAYANLTGTSMASPHVAGAAALLLEARPGTPALQVRDIFQNSAVPHVWSGNPGLGFFDLVHRQGAGMIKIADAIQATTLVQPGKLSLGEFEAGSAPIVRTLTFTNNGTSAVTYDLSHTPALATGGSTYAPSFFAGFASVSFSAPSVTVPAGGTATVNASIVPSVGLADRSQYGGWVVATPQGGGRELRVPYSGFKGDYQSIQVLVPTTQAYPWLAKIVAGAYVKQAAGVTFTMQGDDFPVVLYHFEHQARRLEIAVHDAATGQPVHPVFHTVAAGDYLGRNSGATTFFGIIWDGTRIHSNSSNGHDDNVKFKDVPDGQYVLVLKVLKALGDANNPAHWETWTTPAFTIDRP
jgi:subtilisin family serine protease